MKRSTIFLVISLFALFIFASCGGGGGSDSGDGTPMMWTWMSGSDTTNQIGVYPILFSVPGARYDSVSWTDSADNLWLFGGYGLDLSGSTGHLNDLWRFDGTYWTWMSGIATIDNLGVYGIMGSPEASNMPGARDESVSWTDSTDNLWLFGGRGYPGSGGTSGLLNDLWRFDGTYWTWMLGDSTINSPGVYGTMGSPEASNVPGARYESVSWTDSADNLWLFGGFGYDGSGGVGWLNDLWRFDGTYWTWMSGEPQSTM
jgi:N-acetylneuraminic acid mutarotase